MILIKNLDVIAKKLGVETFRVTPKSVYDYKTDQYVKTEVGLMWVIRISYKTDSASLAFIRTSEWQQCVFIPITKNTDLSLIHPIRLSVDLDNVTSSLENLNLAHDKYMWQMGDPGHRLAIKIETPNMSSEIVYISGSPNYHSQSMKNLWDSIQSLINYIVVQSNNKQLEAFVNDNWWEVPK